MPGRYDSGDWAVFAILAWVPTSVVIIVVLAALLWLRS